MHQLTSTVLSFILSPVIWILVLVIASFVIRQYSVNKICRILALILFLVFSDSWLLDWYARKFQPAPLALTTGVVYSCGVVAGGFGSPDAEGNGMFNGSADRFIQVLKLYKQGYITHIIVSGGNGKNEMKAFREGEWAKKELMTIGVPGPVIFVEDKSRNTAENAVNSKKILDSFHLGPPYLLISSAHHLPRALLLFKNAGVDAVAFPCNYIAGRGIPTVADVIPDVGTLFTWEIYLKETAGYWWYR